MPFGLTNAPASFQNLVNYIFQDLLDVYAVAYLDDIMVFCKSEEEHIIHVSTILSRLRANNLFAKPSKCLFHVSSVEYLGYVVTSEGLKMDQSKVQQILTWPPPRNLKDLQSFLGFANFYRRFIKNYSMISSLTSFLNKEALSQFHQLKEAFTTAPILSHFNPSLPTIVETNTSNYALGAVLSQVSDSGKHPIAFDRHKLIPAELNYEIHDKELLGIVWALKRWRAFLLSLSSPFEVLTDHSSLQKFLTHCEARWAEFLSEFYFSITYCPGCLDTLSCWNNVYPERGEDFISNNPTNFQQLIKQDEVQPSRYFAVKVESFSNLIESIQKKLWQYSQYRSILQELGKAGHPGQEKTLKLFKWDFHWWGMTQFIKDYVSSCQQCPRNKNIHHKKFGLLKPLPIPNGPWICLSMDFITQLPLSNSFDSILDIVDRFSKMAVFIPTRSSITSLDLAHLFIKNIFSKNGLPSIIQLNISRDLSTASHQETDGQTERVNQILEQYLQPDPQFDSVHITQDNPAGNLSTKIQSVHKDIKRELEAAINRFKRYADKSRESPPDFNPGDMKVSTHAYHLKLPSQWKSIHPVFHISLLEPVKTSTIPNQHKEPPPPIIMEEEEEWEVSQILDSKLERVKLWYLVEWKGFSQDSERSTWEPTENLNNCPELIKDFPSLYPDNPGPNSSKA
ncbi:hypothetical protein O181_093322 [Austropuccinia psidii MF-1]|uniref:Reverse transcriptase domain-containing protein n=1 Tax=Austropuccinia psidii MF-1 TaxID=1389203 RepID=A0A9Q3J187_9BASI|nr:hypothetical protein [Austropuccinia psidii MF-1]